MRASWAMAVVLLGLGACLGAALVTRENGGRTATGTSPQTPAPLELKYQPEVDKKKIEPLTPAPAPKDFGERAFAHVRALTSFGVRTPGSPGWTKQLEYIEATLRSAGLAVQRDTWTDRKELLTFTNLTATIPGKKKERILLACHHDTKCTTGHTDPAHNFHFVGANDGASGTALLLALAPVLLREERDATIELVFFDGEESLDWSWNEGARALFGSKRYVKRHRDALLLGEEPRIVALILLDMVGRTDLHIQEELFSTERLRTIAWSAAVACGHQKHFYQRAEAASDDHKPFLDVGIPAVDLIDLNGNPHWHKPTDTLENLSAQSLQITADVVLTMLPEVERVYVRDGK